VDARQGGRRDLALGILAEARRHNPGDYRIPMQRGRVLLRSGEVQAAARAFDAALAMWETSKGVAPARRELDRAALLDYRGFVYELEGDQAAALDCYRERARARPGLDGSQAVIRELEEGRRSRRDAERQLAVLMGSAIDPDEQCRHDGDHGETHGHPHGAHAH
jgi:tetratricopeptide (TPR) repeat protein